MPVSVEARPVPAKAMAVSRPRRHSRAQATAVSDKRAAWSTGPDCGTRGRRQGLAGQRADAPSHTPAHHAPPVRRAPEEPEGLAAVPVGGGGAWPGTPEPQAPPVWRAPEGPEGTGGLRGAAPNEVRTPSLAGGRGLRRPEHQRGNKHQHAARTARGRDAAHGRTKQPNTAHNAKPPGPIGTRRHTRQATAVRSRGSADTPRRAVAAVRDGDAGGGQAVT